MGGAQEHLAGHVGSVPRQIVVVDDGHLVAVPWVEVGIERPVAGFAQVEEPPAGIPRRWRERRQAGAFEGEVDHRTGTAGRRRAGDALEEQHRGHETQEQEDKDPGGGDREHQQEDPCQGAGDGRARGRAGGESDHALAREAVRDRQVVAGLPCVAGFARARDLGLRRRARLERRGRDGGSGEPGPGVRLRAAGPTAGRLHPRGLAAGAEAGGLALAVLPLVADAGVEEQGGIVVPAVELAAQREPPRELLLAVERGKAGTRAQGRVGLAQARAAVAAGDELAGRHPGPRHLGTLGDTGLGRDPGLGRRGEPLAQVLGQPLLPLFQAPGELELGLLHQRVHLLVEGEVEQRDRGQHPEQDGAQEEAVEVAPPGTLDRPAPGRVEGRTPSLLEGCEQAVEAVAELRPGRGEGGQGDGGDQPQHHDLGREPGAHHGEPGQEQHREGHDDPQIQPRLLDRPAERLVEPAEDGQGEQGGEQERPGRSERDQHEEVEEDECQEQRAERRIRGQPLAVGPQPVAPPLAAQARVGEEEEAHGQAIEGGPGEGRARHLEAEVRQHVRICEHHERPGTVLDRQRTGVDEPVLALVDDGAPTGLPGRHPGAEPGRIGRLLEEVLPQVAPFVRMEEDLAGLERPRVVAPALDLAAVLHHGVLEARRQHDVDERSQGRGDGDHRDGGVVGAAQGDDELGLAGRPGVDRLDVGPAAARSVLRVDVAGERLKVLAVTHVDHDLGQAEADLVGLAAVPVDPVQVVEGEAAESRPGEEHGLRAAVPWLEGAVRLFEQSRVGPHLLLEIAGDAVGDLAQRLVPQAEERVGAQAAPDPQRQHGGDQEHRRCEPTEVEPREVLPALHGPQLDEGPAQEDDDQQDDEAEERQTRQGETLAPESLRSHESADEPRPHALVRLLPRHRHPQGADEEVVPCAREVHVADAGRGLPALEQPGGRILGTPLAGQTAEARQADLAVLLLEQHVAVAVRHQDVIEHVAGEDGGDQRLEAQLAGVLDARGLEVGAFGVGLEAQQRPAAVTVRLSLLGRRGDAARQADPAASLDSSVAG